MLTAVVFAIIRYHEHHLPLKDVAIVDETARDTRKVLVALHLLQLSSEQTCSTRFGWWWSHCGRGSWEGCESSVVCHGGALWELGGRL